MLTLLELPINKKEVDKNMLYKKNAIETLEKSLFQNPTSEYRGTPFWSWNCRLDRETILEQIEIFKEMGFGGFHIHSRTGLETPYLSDEFMTYIKLCNEKAIEEGMLCWLYDEDRYPSGAAGGVVTQDVSYRARHLLLSRNMQKGFEESREEFEKQVEKGYKPAGYYITSYQVILKDGFLHEYKRVNWDDLTHEGDVWHAFVRLEKESPWYNDQTYVDTLNKLAIERFIEVTHEKYYEVLGSEFGESIPAIFTDEPQVSKKSTLSFAEATKDATISFTDDLPDTYKKAYGIDLLDVIPELFWELPEGEVSQARYRYHNHLADRFVSAFSDTLGDWCERHNIALTGHFMSESTLYSQTLALGEAMRCYRSFQIPGIDILCDAKELSTAKQAVSVAHQYGREGVISELYGVTHWYHDFKGHKLQGDWQAALGITIRVPHLAFMSMAGESKRDWPASINYQSPWYKEYPYVEDHFARLNTALTRGKNSLKIGVIHPIESFWLAFGPNDQTGERRQQYDEDFENLISWMLYGLLDFDFISESLLPELCSDGKFPLEVGEMSYETIIVPNCRTMRKTTLKRLQDFRAAGGRVIFMGDVPSYIDALPSDGAVKLAEKCEKIQFNKVSLLNALECDRELDIRLSNGRRSDNLFYQLRDDNGGKWLFICHVNRRSNKVDKATTYRIRIKGKYKPTIYDTITGEIIPCPAEINGDHTIILQDMYAEDSLLLYLEDGEPSAAPTTKTSVFLKPVIKIQGPVDYTLSEPNVLLLDKAEYSFDGGKFNPSEEILRIDNLFREKLGYPSRRDHVTQPWAIKEEGDPQNTLMLRYTFISDIKVTGAKLAMERPEDASILLNGEKVKARVDGYFTDKAIKTLALPHILEGKNELILEIPFGRKTNVEWCYILGKFGVRMRGTNGHIEKIPKKLGFGDWVTQGLPFYAGNVTYRYSFNNDKKIKNAVLEIPHFSAPVIGVHLDSEKKGVIAYAPHRLSMGDIDGGQHTLEITVYGNRYNSFGTLHNADDEYQWYGPDSYRTKGNQWTDSYLLRPMGVITSPVIYEREDI